VGFGVTLKHLAGLASQETAPARAAAVGRCGRNAGELAVRPANAHARERSRGAGGC
jgi:hypothetical protein